MVNRHMELRTDLSDDEWDKGLVGLGGHPLQSSLWGNAKQNIYGINQYKLAAFNSGSLTWMARVETRKAPLLGKIAWIPRGPVHKNLVNLPSITEQLRGHLRERGYILMVCTPWQRYIRDNITDVSGIRDTTTIWIDLAQGKNRLWSRLDKQWRYGVRRARKNGIATVSTSDNNDIVEFFRLCRKTSEIKRFKMTATQEFMMKLLETQHNAPVKAMLFITRVTGAIAAGAMIITCGRHVHYMWGGMDRQYAKCRVGEAVQWSVMEWACDNNYILYDLEGIDSINNPGVADFKRKMGGDEIRLYGMQKYPVSFPGRLIAQFI